MRQSFPYRATLPHCPQTRSAPPFAGQGRGGAGSGAAGVAGAIQRAASQVMVACATAQPLTATARLLAVNRAGTWKTGRPAAPEDQVKAKRLTAGTDGDGLPVAGGDSGGEGIRRQVTDPRSATRCR